MILHTLALTSAKFPLRAHRSIMNRPVRKEGHVQARAYQLQPCVWRALHHIPFGVCNT